MLEESELTKLLNNGEETVSYVKGMLENFEQFCRLEADISNQFDAGFKHFQKLIEKLYAYHKKQYPKYFSEIFKTILERLDVALNGKSNIDSRALAFYVILLEFFDNSAENSFLKGKNPVNTTIKWTLIHLLKKKGGQSDFKAVEILIFAQLIKSFSTTLSFIPEFYHALQAVCSRLQAELSSKKDELKEYKETSFHQFLMERFLKSSNLNDDPSVLLNYLDFTIKTIDRTLILCSGEQNFSLLFSVIELNLLEISQTISRFQPLANKCTLVL
eukprot:TRINITY_DN11439_c0_g1_i3.p1 TRINITY_DN11439_c0_g1~~TRINITY_DN11439_c0_g1_i3.p1  ORF type:complete len:273 (+),score=46.35 TRINITY_DN11439_c0_g1_i3:101-919(+)